MSISMRLRMVSLSSGIDVIALILRSYESKSTVMTVQA